LETMSAGSRAACASSNRNRSPRDIAQVTSPVSTT
jgi:hypothetical protein